MSTRVIWIILIRLSSFWLILDMFTFIPQTAMNAIYYTSFASVFVMIFALGFYIVVTWFLLAKAEWIMDKLGLNKGLEEESITGNVQTNTIYKLAILLMGGYFLLDGLIALVTQILFYINQNRLINEYYDDESSIITFDFILFLIQSLLGYFLITNVSKILAYIDRQKIKATEQDKE